MSRVYLNAPSARTAFNYSGPTRVVGTTGSEPGGIHVSATQAWTDTGLDVRQGDRYTITATGEVTVAPGMTATADGNPSVHNPNFPDPTVPVGALIGKIGNGPVFGVGAHPTFAMPGTGRLMLGVNDTELGDNGGSFTVVITRIR